jgi:hypothetical protein
LTVSEAGNLSLPELLDIAGSNITISGNGVFEAPKLATMSGVANGTRYISVSNDGFFDAPLLASLVNVRLFAATGAALELPALTEFYFDQSCGEQIIGSSGVRVSDSLPSLVSLPILEELTFLAPNGCVGFSIYASSGGAIDLSALTSVVVNPANPYDHTFRASGAGSVVDLSALPALDAGLALYIDSGGELLAPSMASMLGNVSILTGTSVSLPAATSFASLTMNISGSLALPALTSIADTTVTMSETGNLVAPELLTVTGSNITINGDAEFDAPKLASMAGAVNGSRYISVTANGFFNAPVLTSLTNVRLFAATGASLVLPQVTGFTFDVSCGEQIIGSSGVGASGGAPSLVSLPSLESMSFLSPNGCVGFLVSATTGAAVNLSTLTTVTLNPATPYNNTFRAADVGSLVDLSALATFPVLVVFDETGGGDVQRPAKSARLGEVSASPFAVFANDWSPIASVATRFYIRPVAKLG